MRSIARFRPRAKILGFSPDPRTVNQLTMSWGTTPYLLDDSGLTEEERAQRALEQAVEADEVHPGDTVVVLGGSGIYRGRVTDTVRIIHIP